MSSAMSDTNQPTYGSGSREEYVTTMDLHLLNFRDGNFTLTLVWGDRLMGRQPGWETPTIHPSILRAGAL